MKSSRSRRRAPASILLGLLLLGPSLLSAGEAPPEQGSTLRFRKTLGIQPTGRGKVFFETRTLPREDSLSRILTEEYGVAHEAIAPLTEAFRSVNRDADPEHLRADQEVRIPFKIEETVSSEPRREAPEPSSYTVREGESLWRILKYRFQVPRAEMETAVAAVARANPGVKNWNHLVPGQNLVVPQPYSGAGAARTSPKDRDVLALLRDLGCRVSAEGRTFLPVARGRSVHVDHRDFPAVTGLSGRSILFDPSSRMSPALIRAIEDSPDYAVLQGREDGPEGLLQRILPRMGFHELSEGPRTASLGPGLDLVARPRWTVVSRREDQWEGRVHLIFSAGSELAPAPAAAALRAGFSLHVLGGQKLKAAGERSAAAPELTLSDAAGAGILLGLLGIPHDLRPEVSYDLGEGVRYKVRPELTFRHAGISYAVPPAEPARAESLLERAGYVTVPWTRKAPLLDRVADLLALVGVSCRRAAVELPKGDQPLKLRVEGLLLEEPRLVKALYPKLPPAPKPGRTLLLTEGDVDPQIAAALRAEGYLPWVVRER